jgi:hypothetical protein
MSAQSGDEETITLAVDKRTMQVIRDFAASQGLDVKAYLNEVLQSQAEWHIPMRSFEPITVPKKMLPVFFSLIDPGQLDMLTRQWAGESKNIILLSGRDFNLETAVAFGRLIAKYFVGGDAKMVESPRKDTISMVVRHDAGEHFSFFCAPCYRHFFNLFPLRQVIVEHDPSTIFIMLEIATDEMEGMKHYLDEVLKEVRGAGLADRGN